MTKSWKKIGLLMAACILGFALAPPAQASTVVSWYGFNAFNNSFNGIIFPGFAANQLSSISGFGTYEASLDRGNPVSTTFTLSLDLNNTWTSIYTWSSSDPAEQLLSAISTPINFSTGTVSGISLSASPQGSFFDPTFDNFDFFNFFQGQLDPEQFTFNDVASTPLPATLPLLAGGLAFLGYLVNRKKRAQEATVAF